MKKYSVTVCCLILSLLLSGCAAAGSETQDVKEAADGRSRAELQETQNAGLQEAPKADAPDAQGAADREAQPDAQGTDTQDTDAQETVAGETQPVSEEAAEPDAQETSDSPAELAAPEMTWWELYNPNGFNTVTAEIVNPNSVPVDISYDLVYYRNGTETARSEGFANFSILPGRKDLIWANYDIPGSADADDVKIENIVVTEAFYEPVDGSYEYAGTENGEEIYTFSFDKKPTLATVWFLLYNDNNGNGKFDKGEIVAADSVSLTEQTETAGFDTGVMPYTDCDIYFTAY